MLEIKLGQKVKCIVTGFEGIATAKIVYLNGCIQYCVKPQSKEPNAITAGEYIDIQQLEIVDNGINVKKKKTGGVMSDMPKGFGLSNK